MRRAVFIAMAALTAIVAPVATLADTSFPTHESVKDLFSTGEAQGNSMAGCTKFTGGDISLNGVRASSEKVFSDSTAGKKNLSSTLAHDNPLSSTASSSLFSNRVLASSLTALSSWTCSQTKGFWISSTSRNPGIAQSLAVSNRNAISATAVSLAFVPNKVGAGNGSTKPKSPRGSSPLTEADGLALLGLGLLTTAGLLRRRLTSQAPLRTTPSQQASLLGPS